VHVEGFPIPDALLRLLVAGVWPKTEEDVNRQHLHSLAKRERIATLAPEESEIVLLQPPFRTVRWLMEHGEQFWSWEQAAPSGLDPAFAIPIGDFGLGSDAPIVLDYRNDQTCPRVLRLRYGATHADNRWVQMATTFEALADALDLWHGKP
jgi:hypothetical protein